MISLETSGGWVASLMSERIVTTGVRSRRFRIGSSSRISEWPTWSRGIERPRRLEPLAAAAARHDGDVADVLTNLRNDDAGEQELELPAHFRRRKADEVQ